MHHFKILKNKGQKLQLEPSMYNLLPTYYKRYLLNYEATRTLPSNPPMCYDPYPNIPEQKGPHCFSNFTSYISNECASIFSFVYIIFLWVRTLQPKLFDPILQPNLPPRFHISFKKFNLIGILRVTQFCGCM